MERKQNRRKVSNRKKNSGAFKKLFINVGGDPEAIEEEDWYLDTPDVKLTRIFSVVLVLHIIAIGGILVFRLIRNDSINSTFTVAQEYKRPSEAKSVERELAGDNSGYPLRIPLDQGSFYQVEAGDTLSGIAQKLGVSYETLRLVNNIDEPNNITTGMLLDVPLTEESARNPSSGRPLPTSGNAPSMKKAQPSSIDKPKIKQVEPVEDDSALYEVKPGDTVWGIARKFQVEQEELLRLNGISRPELLQVGQTIYIPSR